MNEKMGEQSESQEETKPEIEAQPQIEMPEDLVEPEGKSGKWKTVKGEVEVEGKKVEVSYREKVIELPKHRQEETGIKRIRRRELLPPFPEGLYISEEKRRSQFLDDQWEYYSSSFKYGNRGGDDPHKRYTENTQKLKDNKQVPVYVHNKKFDDFYRFLTDDKYPADNIFCHNLDYRIMGPNLGPGNLPDKERLNMELFKKEGLYFQEIYPVDNNAGKYISTYGQGLWLQGRTMYSKLYATPVFIFSQKNKRFVEYLYSVGVNAREAFRLLSPSSENELVIPIEKSSQNKLRWCHAELALVPTKRSLNVLFFETGDEGERNDEIASSSADSSQ